MGLSAQGPDTLFAEFELPLAPARGRFAATLILVAPTAPNVEPPLPPSRSPSLELFLHDSFAVTGVRIDEPVAGWIHCAAQKREARRDLDLSRRWRGHAAAETGHNLMMVRDTQLKSRQSERLLESNPGAMPALAAIAHDLLEGNGQFLADCLHLATEKRKEV